MATKPRPALSFTAQKPFSFPVGIYSETGKFMYHVPRPRGQTDGLLGGNNERSDNGPTAALTAALKANTDIAAKRDEHKLTGQKTSLFAIGMKTSLLNVISAAEPSVVLAGNIAELLSTTLTHRSIPVDTYCLAQLCKSWAVPDGMDGIKFFIDLKSAYGRFDCESKLRSYRALENYTDASHTAEFKDLFNMKSNVEHDFLNGQIPRMQDALFNFLSAITVVTSMRYCFQDVLFKSGIALMNYITERDLGQQSAYQLPFMTTCIAEMMHQWNEARKTIISQCRREDTVEILALCKGIPDLSRDGAIDRLYSHYRLLDTTKGGNTAAMISIYQQGPQGGSGVEDGSASSKGDKKGGGTAIGSGDDGKKKKPSRRSKKGGEPGASAAPAAASTSPTKNVLPTPRNPHCYGFNGSKGCPNANCKFNHENPAKGSAEAAALTKFFSGRGITPSKDFIRNSQ